MKKKKSIYPKQLQLEQFFSCPVWFADEPSFVWHRVCAVKKGSRYSLVIWNLGWPFK